MMEAVYKHVVLLIVQDFVIVHIIVWSIIAIST